MTDESIFPCSRCGWMLPDCTCLPAAEARASAPAKGRRRGRRPAKPDSPPPAVSLPADPTGRGWAA